MLAADEPVIAVVAPPGYGKSTLLAQWAARRGPASRGCRATGSTTTRSRGPGGGRGAHPDRAGSGAARELLAEDADRLVEHLVAAGRRAHPAGRDRARPAGGAVQPSAGRRSRRSRWPLPTRLRSWPWRRARRCPFPTGADAGRTPPARDRHRRPGDVPRRGIPPARRRRRRAVRARGRASWCEQTEGWPAALYLAALAHPGRRGRRRPPVHGDRPVDERLPPLRGPRAACPARSGSSWSVTSILDRLSGPLGDAVVGGHQCDPAARAAAAPEPAGAVARRRGRVVPLPPAPAQLLQAELRADGARPGRRAARAGRRVVRGERRAGAGDRPRLPGRRRRAVRAAGARGHAAGLGQRSDRHGPPLDGAAGQPSTGAPHAGDDRARRADLRPARPAGRRRALGRGRREPRRLRHAARRRARSRRRWPTCGRTCAARAPRRCVADSAAALAGLGPASPYRATMLHTEGLSYLLEGDLERADASFAHAYDLAASIETSPVAALVLAEQVQIAVERDDWTAAESLVKRALEIVGARPVRRVLDQRAGVRLGRPSGGPPRGHARGPRVRPARGTPAPAAHLCPARRLGPGAGRAGPRLPGPGRPGRRARRAGAGPRHPAAASRPRHPGDRRSPAWTSGSARSPPPRRSAPRR